MKDYRKSGLGGIKSYSRSSLNLLDTPNLMLQSNYKMKAEDAKKKEDIITSSEYNKDCST